MDFVTFDSEEINGKPNKYWKILCGNSKQSVLTVTSIVSKTFLQKIISLDTFDNYEFPTFSS
jgi:hypothetical protein